MSRTIESLSFFSAFEYLTRPGTVWYLQDRDYRMDQNRHSSLSSDIKGGVTPEILGYKAEIAFDASAYRLLVTPTEFVHPPIDIVTVEIETENDRKHLRIIDKTRKVWSIYVETKQGIGPSYNPDYKIMVKASKKFGIEPFELKVFISPTVYSGAREAFFKAAFIVSKDEDTIKEEGMQELLQYRGFAWATFVYDPLSTYIQFMGNS